MKHSLKSRFLSFLEKDLLLSADAITIALGHHSEDLDSEDLDRKDLSLLPITLWKYQLVTIEQVGSMFDWLANVPQDLVNPQMKAL